jgi:hypothetical protein
MCTSTWLAPTKGVALRYTTVVAVIATKGHEMQALDTKAVGVGVIAMLVEGVRALAVLDSESTSDRVGAAEGLGVPVVEREWFPEADGE